MNKTVESLAASVIDIESGMTLMIGGFGGAGAPVELIHALIDRFIATGSPGNLTVVNNNAGNGRIGIAAMIDAGMVAKMVCSFPRSSDPRAFSEKYLAGEIALELVPQGTLAERIRAGGAGIPAFYTPASFGTTWQKASQPPSSTVVCMFRSAGSKPTPPLLKAELADTMGNLTYRKAARNFAADGRRGKLTIVQATSIVAAGEIDPEHVVTWHLRDPHRLRSAPQQEEALLRAGAAYA